VDYAREGACPGCGKQTHVCRNCRFFAPGRANDCQEPIAERVVEKDRANFCDYFEPSDAASGISEKTSTEDLLRAAQDLFK
jgi:hypothetical protein